MTIDEFVDKHGVKLHIRSTWAGDEQSPVNGVLEPIRTYRIVLTIDGKPIEFQIKSNKFDSPTANSVVKFLWQNVNSLKMSDDFVSWCRIVSYSDTKSARDSYDRCVKSVSSMKKILNGSFQDFVDLTVG